MSIHKKLLSFQRQNIKLSKDGINPHFKSEYVTLNEVLEKVKKPLNQLDVVVIQAPEATGLRTTLVDVEDDTKIECFMPYVELSNAQKLGSNNTYNRRYSLITLLGLEDIDDDAESAVERAEVTEPRATTKNNTGNAQVDPVNNPKSFQI